MRETPGPLPHYTLDRLVRSQLKKWPQQPPGVARSLGREGTWLRGRPGDSAAPAHPFLKFPGSNRLRTLPDGLWLHFSPDPLDGYVDILCIEACSSLQNLLDKRSRFAPSTMSLLALCPVPWLLAPALMGDPTPRWRLVKLLRAQPTEPLVLPVRDVRVVFGLKARHYEGFARTQVPHPHEYYCPMEALTAEHADENPAMRALISRAGAAANFMSLPADAAPRPPA